MKNHLSILSFLIIILLNVEAKGQVKGDVIKLNYDIKTSDKPQSAVSGKKLTNNANYLESGIKFKVIDIYPDSVTLKAIPFEPLKPYKNIKKFWHNLIYTKKLTDNRIDKSLVYNNKIYKIKKTDFTNNAEIVTEKDLLSIGLLTLPFKARPQDDFSFDTEFNLNSTLNWSIHRGEYISTNIQIGAGIGTVGLNTGNSLGLQADEAQDVSTLTFLSGIMLQYDKVQVGIYAGVDHINNQNNYKWKSNGDIWYGFGIGYDLFNISLAKTKNKQ